MAAASAAVVVPSISLLSRTFSSSSPQQTIAKLDNGTYFIGQQPTSTQPPILRYIVNIKGGRVLLDENDAKTLSYAQFGEYVLRSGYWTMTLNKGGSEWLVIKADSTSTL